MSFSEHLYWHDTQTRSYIGLASAWTASQLILYSCASDAFQMGTCAIVVIDVPSFSTSVRSSSL